MWDKGVDAYGPRLYQILGAKNTFQVASGGKEGCEFGGEFSLFQKSGKM